MTELSLPTLANLAEFVGAGSIITGLIFVWFQIRHFRAQQRDVVAINLMQTFYDQELAQAIALLQPIPDGVRLEELHLKGDQYVEAAITITKSFETMGLRVFKKLPPWVLF
jgi:hypothetical protein